jgi:hypothetical protein
MYHVLIPKRSVLRIVNVEVQGMGEQFAELIDLPGVVEMLKVGQDLSGIWHYLEKVGQD